MRPRVRTTVLLILVAAIALPVAAQQKGVRMNWQTFAQDPARVQSLRNAVAVMKSRNAADPKSALYRTSWEYWGAMHGYFGPGSVFGTVEEAKAEFTQGGGDPLLLPLYNGIENITPPDAIAQQVWGQCQHGTPWFFAWHRLYLYYFERVLQKAANDPNLFLPYWDYTNPENLAMPAAYPPANYTDAQGHLEANALNEPRRTPGWNTPGGNMLDATATNIDDALQATTFFDTATATGFQSDIEGNVHGYVHCTVVPCPGPDMGAVGYSANDPIFWAHHANIDRMWDCWTSLGNQNPQNPQFLNKKFSFVDADGNLVTNAVADLFNGTIKFDYVYQQASNCARGPAAQPRDVAAAPAPAMTPAAVESARTKLAVPAVLANVKNHAINADVTRTRLPLAGGAMAPVRSLALRGNEALEVETELVLRNIRFDAHPGSQFHVILERRDDPARRVRVGTLSFFRSTKAHEGHSMEINRTFDVTEELRQLAVSAAKLTEVNVVFEATTGLAGATEAAFDPDGKLTVGEIELRVKAME